MEAALVFNRILSAGADATDMTVSVALGNDDNQATQINLALSAVGPLMAVLSAEAEKIVSAVPGGVAHAISCLSAHKAWLSRDSEDRAILVFELQGGVMLPLVMQGEDLSGLAAEMTLLSAR